MSQSTGRGPLGSIYESRIGTPTNDDEVLGYWTFLGGVIAGLVGLVLFFVTDAATTARGLGYAIAALAPPLLVLGAVLRFPLQRAATGLVALGGVLSLAAIVWFLAIFPDGWSLAVGDTGVILTYLGGLIIMGLAGAVVPLAGDPREAAAAAREAELETTIADLEVDIEDLHSSKARFELYQDNAEEWRWRLVHQNGNIIADSGEGYSSKAKAQQGMRSVKRNALGADVETN